MGSIFFESKNKATENSPFILVNADGFTYDAHYHDELEIVYVLSGQTQLIINSISYYIKENDMAIILPGQIHSFVGNTHNRVFLMKTVLMDSTSEFFYNHHLKNSIIQSGDPLRKSLSDQIDIIVNETNDKKIGYEIQVRKSIDTIMLTILRDMEYEYVSLVDKKKLMNECILIEKVNKFIEDNYAEDVCLDDVCREVGISKYYFIHKYKEVSGVGFVHALTVYRLKKALSIMKTGTCNITGAAFNSGFTNLRTFNRAFKRYVGITPSEYIKCDNTKETMPLS